MYYKRVNIIDGKGSNEPVNFVGVHPLIWHDHPEHPEVGFVECDDYIDKLQELCGVSLKIIGEIIDNYEADAINLPAEMYNELKFHWKQLNKNK